MISIFLTICLVVGAIGFKGNGDTWGAVACVGVIVFVWFVHFVSVRDDRASVNWMNYWAKSGKDRAKARHQWEAEARAEELDRAVKRVRTKEPRKPERFTCPDCGKNVEMTGWYARLNGRLVIRYDCPVCGHEYFTETDKK